EPASRQRLDDAHRPAAHATAEWRSTRACCTAGNRVNSVSRTEPSTVAGARRNSTPTTSPSSSMSTATSSDTCTVLATATSESVRYQACTSGSKSTRMASMLRLLVPVSDGYHDIARDHDLEPATRRR